MIVGSHVVAGIAAWTAASLYGHIPADKLAFGYAVAGALLPDIDHPKSWVGRRLRIISVPLSAMVGHRGLTHSLLAVAAGIVVLYGYGLRGEAAPLVVGYLSHLAADALTPGGVPLLWPYRKHFKLGLFRTGSATEYLFTTLMAVGVVWAWGWI